MNWNELNEESQLEALTQESVQHPVLIFKHSTRCSVSRLTLDRLERNWKHEELQDVKPYFLDLITYRNISNAIVEKFNIEHESPQILVIKNGECVLDQSHYAIDYQVIRSVAKN